MKTKTQWTAGKCRVAECPMTLVMPLGGGQQICWLHALRYGLPIVMLATLTACGADTFFFINVEGGITIGDDAGAETSDSNADVDTRDGATSDASIDGDAAVADSAATDAPSDTSVCAYSGPTECANDVSAYCTHYTSCCQQFPGNGNCSIGWNSVNGCKAALAQLGFDCSLSKYNKPVCGSASACVNSTNAMTCNAMFLSTGPDAPASCPAFWSQF